jgi:hypothetical protein
VSEMLNVGDVLTAYLQVDLNYGIYETFVAEKLPQIINECGRRLEERGFQLHDFSVIQYKYLAVTEYPYVIGFIVQVTVEKVRDPIPLTVVVGVIVGVIVLYLGVELVRNVMLLNYYITYREAIEKGYPPPEKPTVAPTVAPTGFEWLQSIPPIAILILLIILLKEVRK